MHIVLVLVLVLVTVTQIYYWKYWEQAHGFALWNSMPCLHGIDFSSFLPQVGMNDLTVVNLHLALSPSAGENTGKNHDSHKLAAFAQTLQETLKGTAFFLFFFLPTITCTLVILSDQKEFEKKIKSVSVEVSQTSSSALHCLYWYLYSNDA